MTHVYYKESAAAIIVFDLTFRDSFSAVSKWKRDLESKVKLPSGQRSSHFPLFLLFSLFSSSHSHSPLFMLFLFLTAIPTLLIGNKSDLCEGKGLKAAVSDEEVEQFARDNNFVGFFKTSAKSNVNVDKGIRLFF